MKIKIIKNEFRGFTLAEALFILYITGIMAMIAIPVVKIMTNITNFPKKWETEYYSISQAKSLAMADIAKKLPPDTDMNNEMILSDDLIDSLESHLDVKVNCGDSIYVCGSKPQVELGDGDKNVYKTLSGGHLLEKDLYKHQLLLKDGANIFCGESKILASSLWVDVNGYGNGPNKLGVDLFGMIITSKDVLPMGAKMTSANLFGAGNCSKNDKYIPVTGFGDPSNYTGATCSFTKLFQTAEPIRVKNISTTIN